MRPLHDTTDLSDTAVARCGRPDDTTLRQADRVPGSRGDARPAVSEPTDPAPFPLGLVLLGMFLAVLGFAAGVIVGGVR